MGPCLTFGYLMSEMYIEEEMLFHKKNRLIETNFIFCSVKSIAATEKTMALAKTELFHALLLGSTILYKNVTFVVRTSAPECAGSSAEASDELYGVRNNNFSSMYLLALPFLCSLCPSRE